MNIGFIGLGKLGLECAEVFAQKYTTRGYDIYPRKSASVEICSPEDTIEKSDWIFIAVPTPHEQGYDGSIPSSHMEPRDFGHDAVIDATQCNATIPHNGVGKLHTMWILELDDGDYVEVFFAATSGTPTVIPRRMRVQAVPVL